MTKYLFILFSALSLGHISIAFADDHSGTINITGSINAHTCEVAAASKDFTVALGQFHPQDFLQTGAVTSMQGFIITLEKCAYEVTTATVTFNGESDTDRPELLKVDASAESATGLAVAILGSNRAIIPLKTESPAYTLSSNSVQIFDLQFYAQYISTRTIVTPGDAGATATFQLHYE